MDDGPDREDEVTRTDVPVARPATGPATDRVRIIGAEPAGEATTELPVVTREPLFPEEDESAVADGSPGAAAVAAAGPAQGDGRDQPSVRLTGEPGGTEGALNPVHPVEPGQTAVPGGTPTELPHWTEPPTGQIPAVLARDPGDTGGAPAVEAPTWREEDADWVAHEEIFEPAMFGDDQVALGSLDETDATDVDKRPWEFDLDPSPSGAVAAQPLTEEHVSGPAPVTIPPITEPVAVVSSHAGSAPGVGATGSNGATGDTSSEPGPSPAHHDVAPTDGSDARSTGEVAAAAAATTARPTGSPRVGRARRAGLLPSRLRAKRPEDVDAVTEAPLAAEPPGASVTDVPGAGRKKRGLAGLAAADRTAEREDEQHAADVAGRARTTPDDVAAVAVGTAAAAGTAPMRSRGGRRDAPVVGATTAPTGGGPPPGGGSRGPESAGRPTGRSSLGLRVGTGVAAAVVALLAFKLGTVPSLVLVIIVVTFAAGECFSVLRRAGYHPATLLGLVGTISLTVGAYSKGVAALPLVLVLITVFTLIWYLFGIERGSPVAGTAATLLAVGWVSLLGSYAGLLLSPSAFPDRHGIAFLLGAIIATVANDVGALVVGGWMGRTPLAPTISPNKTWEGLLGGAVFTIVVSTVVVGAIHPWSASNGALLGVVVAVVAPLGDLCESLLKRDLRLKDMGTLLPGHGGVLDRVDALLFVLPATYYLVRALNIA